MQCLRQILRSYPRYGSSRVRGSYSCHDSRFFWVILRVMESGENYLNLSGFAKAIGKDLSHLSKAKDLPPADAWLKGAGEKKSPLWLESTALAYGQAIEARRIKFTKKNK